MWYNGTNISPMVIIIHVHNINEEHFDWYKKKVSLVEIYNRVNWLNDWIQFSSSGISHLGGIPYSPASGRRQFISGLTRSSW